MKKGVKRFLCATAAFAMLVSSVTAYARDGFFPSIDSTTKNGTNIPIVPQEYGANPSKTTLKPIGSNFITVRDGHFYSGNDRIKFWGTNLTQSSVFPENARADKIADDIASLGFNIVRLHGIDYTDQNDILYIDDPENQKKLDYLVAAFIKRNIYVDIGFYSQRNVVGEGDIQVGITSTFAGRAYYDPMMIQNQKQFISRILNHENPYLNNVKYKNEPGIAMAELINEASLATDWGSYIDTNNDNMYSDEPSRIEFAYQTPTLITLTTLWKDWQTSAFGSIKYSKLPSMNGWAVRNGKGDTFEQATDEEGLDFTKFVKYIEDTYMDTMLNHIKITEQCNILTSGNNQYVGASDLASQSKGDFINSHSYYDHPQLSWNGSAYQQFKMNNTSLIATEGKKHDDNSSFLRRILMSAVKDKPLVVSEWNMPFPNQYEYEGPTAIAAIANAQDWDGLMIFDYEANRDGNYDGMNDLINDIAKPCIQNWFNIEHSPVKRALMPSAAQLFINSYTQPLAKKITINQTQDDVIMSGFANIWDLRMMYNSSYDLPTNVLFDAQIRRSLDPSNSFSTKLIKDDISDTDYIYETEADYSSVLNRTSNIASNEFEWNCLPNNEYIKIAGTKYYGLTGFIGDSADKVAGGLTVKIDNNAAVPKGCSVSLVSMDSKDIRESSSMLLTVAGRQYNTNQQNVPPTTGYWPSGNGLNPWGTDPVEVEKLTGKVQIAVDNPSNYYVFALDRSGKRFNEITPTYENGKVVFNIVDNALWYEIVKYGSTQPTIPTCTIGTATNVTESSTIISNNTFAANGANIIEAGVRVSTDRTFNTNSKNYMSAVQSPFSVNAIGLTANTTYYFQAYIKTADNKVVFSSINSFKTANIATQNPVCNSDWIKDITSNSAIITGNYNAFGKTVIDVGVDITTDSSFRTNQQWFKTRIGSPFSINVTGLKPNTKYYYYTFIQTSDGKYYGSNVKSFTTSKDIIVVCDAGKANSITSNSCVINNNTYNAKGKTVSFAGLGVSTDPTCMTNIKLFAAKIGSPFSVNVTGLKPNTKYYYYAYTKTSDGQTYRSSIKSFATIAAMPTCSTGSASNITSRSAVISNSVYEANGQKVVYVGIGISTDPSFARNQQWLTAKVSTPFSILANGLKPRTTYYYYSYIKTADGKFYNGYVKSFTTASK